MSGPARTSVQDQLMRMAMVIITVSIVLSCAGSLYLTLKSDRESLDSNLLNSAYILAETPLVRNALTGQAPQEELAAFLERATDVPTIDLILVADTENKLYYATQPELVGTVYAGQAQMRALLEEVRAAYDFCLLDAPAGLGEGFLLATTAADRCVVVTTADASSLRDAQHTVMELDRFPAGRLHLVVNRVRKKMLRSMHATIDDAIDRAGLPLLGVVPEDDALPLFMNQGLPIAAADSQGAAAAYRNIAKRLQGERVPLLRIR